VSDPFVATFDAVPLGTFTSRAHGRAYSVTRSGLSRGRAQKLVAKELGVADCISLNLYRTGTGDRLKPGEMPVETVRSFVIAPVPDT